MFLLLSLLFSHDTEGCAADLRWKPGVVGRVVQPAALCAFDDAASSCASHRLLQSIFLACERSEGTFPSAIVLCCMVLCCVV